MNFIGYNLSGPDNGTFMFRGGSEVKRCPVCGYHVDFLVYNPDYQFKRREADKYDGYIKRGADFSSTYDLYDIVSDRFRTFCLEQQYEGLVFGDFSNDKTHFNFMPNRIVRFDALRRNTNFEKRCHACGNYESVVGATPPYLLRSKPLEDGFYRSDLLFGSGDRKGPLILVGLETKAKLKAANLKGLEFSPAFGQSKSTNEIRTLYDSFNREVYSVEEFQFRLEPLLWSYSEVSKETGEAFRRTINDLERILYTIREGEQRVHAKRVALSLLDLIDKEGL